LEAVVAQQTLETVAQEREVLGDHDPQGSSALTVVGPPAGLSTVSVPSRASTRCRSPCRPWPAGSAPPTPSSSTATDRTPSRRAIRPWTEVGLACLAALARASA